MLVESSMAFDKGIPRARENVRIRSLHWAYTTEPAYRSTRPARVHPFPEDGVVAHAKPKRAFVNE